MSFARCVGSSDALVWRQRERPLEASNARLPAVENLIDGKDIPETQAKIAKYQADNRAERLQKSIANLNDRQGTELKGELAPELEAVAPSGHGTSVEGQDWDLDAIRRIVENTPPADREVGHLRFPRCRHLAAKRGISSYLTTHFFTSCVQCVVLQVPRPGETGAAPTSHGTNGGFLSMISEHVAQRLERISGGWNEEAAKKRVETEFLCSLAF